MEKRKVPGVKGSGLATMARIHAIGKNGFCSLTGLNGIQHEQIPATSGSAMATVAHSTIMTGIRSIGNRQYILLLVNHIAKVYIIRQ